MRSKDLKTDGTAYYYATSETWMRWAHNSDKVVILDATPGRWRYDSRTGEWTRRNGGQEILVEIVAQGGNAARRLAVRSQSIRGEWDACVAQRAESHAAKQQAEQVHRAKMRAIADPCLEIAEELTRLGISADVEENERHLYARILIPHRAAPALQSAVAHLIATGWTAPAE